MITSVVRQKLTRGEPVLTAKTCYADPELVELMASAGFDALWICLEHKRLDPATTYSLIQACRLGSRLDRRKNPALTGLTWNTSFPAQADDRGTKEPTVLVGKTCAS